MYDIVTIGSATQDNYITSSALVYNKRTQRVEFPLGTKIEADRVLLEVGGGATNVAATCVRFGLRTSVVSQCGDDPSGEFVLSELKKMRIDTRHMVIRKGARTGYAVIFLTNKGERTIFVYRGVTEKHTLDRGTLQRVNTKWLYVSSLGNNTSSIRTVFAQKQRGVNIAWNPGKEELKNYTQLRRQFADTDVLFVNEEEARLLTKKKHVSKQVIRTITKNIVVITLGEKGSRCFVGDTELRVRVKKVTPADTTGAGDAFGSGFITGILTSRADLSHALYMGSANAMSVVTEVGAKHGLVTPRTLTRFSKKIRITT